MNKQRLEYPRPQFRRDNWLPLNGEWEFAFDGEHLSEVKFDKKIVVPFSYQYAASGIGDKTHHDRVWYRRSFEIDGKDRERGALLCFNGSDYKTEVWINGVYAAVHTGGFAPFAVDITKYLNRSGKNEIIVGCYDPLDPTTVRGKQSWIDSPFACWYVPNSGIWQSVWIDFFDGDALSEYTLTPDIDKCAFYGDVTTLNGVADAIEFDVKYDGKTVKTARFSLDGKHTRYNIGLMEIDFVDEKHFWTPEHPNLFYVDMTLLENGAPVDTAHTRFGMRKVSIDNGGNICLNNRLIYQRLILDQGYWKESGLTPPSVDDIKKDIELAKAMGFNGARKHQKLEDPYFYYLADELGYLTWCEMPSAYNFNAQMVRGQISEWQEIIAACRNFTSVVCYVPLNESWGTRKIQVDADQQNYARAMYYITKSTDPSRLVSTNDGWEQVDATDIIGIHDYAYDSSEFERKYRPELYDTLYPQGRKLMANGCKYGGQPVIFTEFGGVAMQDKSKNGNWGYGNGAATKDEFYSRLDNLLQGVKSCPFGGYCYTQLTDVQQEVNGLLDEDHKPKFDNQKLKKIFEI